LKAKGVTIRAEQRSRSSLWPSLLSTLLPIMLLAGLWMLMLRQAGRGGSALGYQATLPVMKGIVAGPSDDNRAEHRGLPPDPWRPHCW
jgi:hypothetical protein